MTAAINRIALPVAFAPPDAEANATGDADLGRFGGESPEPDHVVGPDGRV